MSKTGGRQIARESPTARPWPISSDIRASRMRNLASGGGPSGFHPAKTCTPGTRGRGSGPYPYANRAVRRLAGRHQSGGQLQRFNMDEIVAAGVDKHRREIHFFGHCLEIGQFCTPVEQSSEEHRRNTVNNRNQPRIPELTLRIETTQRQIRSQISQRRNNALPATERPDWPMPIFSANSEERSTAVIYKARVPPAESPVRNT